MTIHVPGLTQDTYAEMRRESGSWGLYIKDVKVGSVNHTAAFAPLGRDHYMILGTGKDEGRVIRFADPHRHSDCSLLDGMTQIPEMVALTEYAGALTDHGVMYGFLTYYKAMKAAGKKPIIGFEAYMEGLDGQLKGNHLVLLAKNEQGVKNLFKLTSEGYDNFKRKPHVTWAMLEKYHEGVVALSACLAGVIPSALLNENEDAARYAIKRFISIFGTEDFYIELQRHYIHEEDIIRPKLIQLAKEYGLKVVASTDSHYPRKEDARAHELLLCLQTDKTMDDPTHMKFPGTGYHIHTSEEMEELFADCPEALDNTLDLAEKCDVELKLNEVNLPKYEIPKRFSNASEYMVYLAQEGFKEHFGGTEHEKDPVYTDRFDYEIKMIQQMGFESYFIIVWDFINYCRKHDIYVGPGRGSAAGSIVAYCLGITDIDPIKYNLLFERFLNPERVSWPDIDSDIEFSRRPEVIKYMTKKYGEENVCHIVTFGTLAAKQAVRDVARCLNKPVSYSTRLSGLIPKGPGMTIDQALNTSPEFRNAYNTDQDAHEIIDLAQRLEGNRRHASQHACGIVLAPTQVSDYLPTSMERDTETGLKALTSQVEKDEVEALSLIKMDLLGLKNMGVIHEVMDRIMVTRGESSVRAQLKIPADSKLRYQDIPLDDRASYKMLAQGLTGGVFQLESAGMTSLVQELLADIDSLPEERMGECFERIVAAVALYRPGPMDYIPDYLSGVKDPANVHYDCPEEESILASTYGVLVYQEQLMQIARKLAGYTMGEADVIRKACAKKKQHLLVEERKKFIYGNKADFDAGKTKHHIIGCVDNGIPEKVAIEIWEKMEKFGKYAFNRSHAVCYAYISIITAYMACHWTEEFYASLLNAFIENSDKAREYLRQASARNIKLLPPDINLSMSGYLAESGSIRFGLQGISGLKSVAEDIIAERGASGPFKTYQDLYDRMARRDAKLNKKSLEGLIYGNALSVFSDNKADLLAGINVLESNDRSTATARQLGQFSLFGDAIELPTGNPPMKPRVELEHEFEVLGIYLTRHPADDLLTFVSHNSHYKTIDYLLTMKLDEVQWNNRCETVGLISNLKQFYTRNNEPMCSFTLSTKYSSIPCVMFPKDFQSAGLAIRDNTVVGVCGCVGKDIRNEETRQLIVEQVMDEDTVHARSDKVDVIVHNKEEQNRVLNFIKQNGKFVQNGRTKDTAIAVYLVSPDGKRTKSPRFVCKSLKNLDYLRSGYRNAV